MAEKYIPYDGTASPGDFQDGAIIDSTHFTNEFDQLGLAFGTDGHNHDGTAGSGPKIGSGSIVTTDTYDMAGLVVDSLTITSGTAVTSIDTDLSSVSSTDNTLASAKAIKTYVDAQVDTADQLTELTDVTITSVADNEVLAYNNATSKWINQTATEAGLQPNDAGLTSIAGLTTAANKMIYTTGPDVYTTTTLTAAGRAILDDADASAQRTTLGLAIGTDVQAHDAGLASIAGLTTAADKMIYTTALDTYATTTLSSFGRSLIDDANAAGARTTLGLGTAATTASTDYATSTQGTKADDALPKAGGTMTGEITFTEDQTFAVTETMISDLGAYITDYTVTETDVTAHQAALSITESQISDLGAYITGNQTITLSGDATGSGTTAITVDLAANTVGVNELNLTDGTAGQFLKTDGAGTISFADAPTQQTSFTTLDVDNLNLDGNTVSATSGGIVLYTEGNGTFNLSAGDGGGFGNPNVVPTLYFTDRGNAGTVGVYGQTGTIRFQAPDEDDINTVHAQIDARMDPDTATSGLLDITVASNGFSGPGTGGIGFSLDGKNDRIFIYGADLRFTSGRGIDFSLNSNASGMTDELLDDYEEGTWTPNLSTASGTFSTMNVTGVTCSYVKIGKQVTLQGAFNTSDVSIGTAIGGLRLTGIPFVPANDHARGACYGALFAGERPTQVSTDNANHLEFWYSSSVTSNPSLLQASDLMTGASTNNIFRFTITYEV